MPRKPKKREDAIELTPEVRIQNYRDTITRMMHLGIMSEQTGYESLARVTKIENQNLLRTP